MTKLSLSWNEIPERAMNIAHNSAVKIVATIGRDEYVKVRKSSGTTHTLTTFGSISIDANRWGVQLCMIQSRGS